MASILLEELKAVYKDFDYETTSIDFAKNEQKEDWFLKINPKSACYALLGAACLTSVRFQWAHPRYRRSQQG